MKKKESILVYKHKSIIRFEGTKFLNEVGIDGRIFKALTYSHISVGVISQQAIENGLSILVSATDAEKAVECLNKEFKEERTSGKVKMIYSIDNVSVIGFVTRDYQRIAQELARNAIFPLILSQNTSEYRVSIVVASSQTEIAKSIIESEIYGKPKTVHLAIFGHGNVGGTLIDQVLSSRKEIRRRKNVDMKIVGVANSKKLLFDKEGIGEDWRERIEKSEEPSDVTLLVSNAKESHIENLIAVDNTGSTDFVTSYGLLVENGFDLVSSNKIFNTLSIDKYRELRRQLVKNTKRYLYETNVGAGLPLIDTIHLLHHSGENITKIKGVFSGSLSYIFNRFSKSTDAFSKIVQEAMEKGYTEPDPREDLSGLDVARKLLILARELDLENELSDVQLDNLIPSELQNLTNEEFLDKLSNLDEVFEQRRKKLSPGKVLRYVGELSGDLQREKGSLKVELAEVSENSPLGQLKGSDSVFEIFTDSYGDNPIVIMGAGAGAKVTARGVFGDILRISDSK